MCTLCQARDPGIETYDMHGAENFSNGDVSVAATKPVYTYDQIADYLTQGFWSEFGTVARHFDVQSGGTITYSLSGLAAYGAETARKALDAWTAVSGLHFQEVAATSAQMVFDDNYSGAYASSTVSAGHIIKSTINVHSSWSNYGSYYFQTFMHEIGHALGLGHTGDYNGSADYTSDAGYANDSWQTSVMSYFSQSENTWTGATHMYLATLQLGDIAAIHRLYGTPVNVETGTTVYGDGQTTGRFGMDLAGNLAVAIVDSGGTDLINLASRSQNQYLSLVEETFSNINGKRGNFSIGRDTIIENVITGSGNDHIVGNAADNRIESGAGDDLIEAGAGNDTLIGGTGWDTLTGGPGDDVFVMRVGDGSDTITDFEIGGASGGDRIDVGAHALHYDQIQFSTSHEGLRVHLLTDSILLRGIATATLDASAFLGLLTRPAPVAGDIEMIGVGLQCSEQYAYRIVDGATAVTVRYLGNPVGPASLAGWQAIHAGSDGATGYNLLWQHRDGTFVVWDVDSTGAYKTGTIVADLVDYEERFDVDLSGDGIIGHTLDQIERTGVELWVSSARNTYWIIDGETALTVRYLGSATGPDSLAGWRALQAESDFSGGYNLLWQHEDGTYVIWDVDPTGAYETGAIIADVVDYEERFHFDLSGDGIVGHTFDQIEGSGVELWSSSTRNTYWVVEGDITLTVRYLGNPIGPDSLAGWRALQAESDFSGGYNLLWQHEDGTYVIWDVDSTGAYETGAIIADEVDYEERFHVDLSGDGIIGHTMSPIERTGVELWASSTRNAYQIVDGETALAVQYLGNPTGPESFAGWRAMQAASDVEGYNLLWQHEDGTYVIWDVDTVGGYKTGAVIEDVADYEERFGFDINGDGVMGEWIA